MKRRALLAAGIALAMARPGAAQQSAERLLAIAMPSGAADKERFGENGSPYWHAFFTELRRLGDVEGRNLTVERYAADGRPEGYAAFARDVVSRHPSVIVTNTNILAQRFAQATGTIAIVAGMGDPVEAGVVQSLARPGGNVTGVSVNAGPEIWGKRLQILKEAVPSASRAVFLNPSFADDSARGAALRQAAERVGLRVGPVRVQPQSTAEYRRAFAAIAAAAPDGILVGDSAEMGPYEDVIVELVTAIRIPAIYPFRNWVEKGGLMSYGSDLAAVGRHMADQVHQILGGASPGETPIYQESEFSFVLNTAAARRIAFTIPPTLLARAGEVIE